MAQNGGAFGVVGGKTLTPSSATESLRRLPRPGPPAGHRAGARRVMTTGRVPRWAPGLRPDEDGSSSHDIAQ